MKRFFALILSAIVCGLFLFGCDRYDKDITINDINFYSKIVPVLPTGTVRDPHNDFDPGVYVDVFVKGHLNGVKIKDLSFTVVITSSQNPLYQFREPIKYDGVVSAGMGEYYSFEKLNNGDFIIDKVELADVSGKKNK